MCEKNKKYSMKYSLPELQILIYPSDQEYSSVAVESFERADYVRLCCHTIINAAIKHS